MPIPSDLELLWLALAVLYVGEGLWWLPWNTLALESLVPGGRWRLRATSGWPTTRRRALLALWPAPAGLALQLEPSRLHLSPAGLAVGWQAAWTTKGRPDTATWYRRWHDIESIELHGDDLVIDGETILRLPNPEAALATVRRLRELHQTPESAREIVLDAAWGAATDGDRVRQRMAEVESSARPLRWSGAALGTWLLVVSPLVLSRLGGARVLLVLAAVAAALVLVQIGVFASRHRRLAPDARWQRAEAILVMLFNWPAAARAATTLARHALTGVHPVAAALVVADTDSAAPILGPLLRDTAHPLDLGDMATEAREIVLWHRAWLECRLRAVARDHGFAWMTSPPTAGAICPRCRARYDDRGHHCPDCPGVALLSAPGSQGDT